MKLRKNRPLLLVDIAVPRDIDPEVNMMPNVYLYNIDDLQAIAEDYLKQRKEEIVQCEKIIVEKAKPLLGNSGEPGITGDVVRVPCSVLRDSKSKGSV
jgi:glutamyl-tRNA reductase